MAIAATPQNRPYLNWGKAKSAIVPAARPATARRTVPTAPFPAIRFYLKALAK
jgi:hypothetical protein